MCILCVTKAISYPLGIKGWFLVRATTEDGAGEFEKDEWGLVRQNEPDFIFKTTPIPEPPLNDNSTKEEEKVYSDWSQKLWDFRQELVGSPTDGANLVKSAIEAGWNENETPIFTYWLFDYLGKVIRDQKPEVF